MPKQLTPACVENVRTADTLIDRTPANIEAQVMGVNTRASLDDLAAALDAADWLLSRAKTIDVLMRRIAIDWIEASGPFTIGDIEYSVGYSTAVKCLNVSKTSHRLLEVLEGDFDQFVSTLVSQPFKHGSVRNVLQPSEYGRLFQTSRTGKLVHGIPEKVLKRVDQRFLPSRSCR